jgi:hypothetical protein
MSQNRQIKVLINYLTFRSEFFLLIALIIGGGGDKQTVLLSFTSTPVELSWGKAMQDSSSVRIVG